MTTRIAHVLTYSGAFADVAAMLADPAFREEVCARQGVLRHSVRVSGRGAGMEVVVDRVHSADGLPSVARKLVGDEINIVQVERWTDADAADVTVTIPGKPAEMSGHITLTEDGGSTVESVTLDVRVGIPLVGGKIEDLVADLMVAALKAENKVGRDYLSR
jgi:uncharacterized protein DUF2505